jgi:hypothetical protein
MTPEYKQELIDSFYQTVVDKDEFLFGYFSMWLQSSESLSDNECIEIEQTVNGKTTKEQRKWVNSLFNRGYEKGLPFVKGRIRIENPNTNKKKED